MTYYAKGGRNMVFAVPCLKMLSLPRLRHRWVEVLRRKTVRASAFGPSVANAQGTGMDTTPPWSNMSVAISLELDSYVYLCTKASCSVSPRFVCVCCMLLLHYKGPSLGRTRLSPLTTHSVPTVVLLLLLSMYPFAPTVDRTVRLTDSNGLCV
ncbi:hypothetical protein GQ44DRAFT_488179 [Phaeosphaeriaceae sp. PMI808]|nr:hypothetical protein GQ44DRAFT_488179 [Phaeosphaeriaceae sp. PMI808]